MLRSCSHGREIEPQIGLCGRQGVCFRFSLSLSLCPSPVHSLSLNNNNNKFEKKETIKKVQLEVVAEPLFQGESGKLSRDSVGTNRDSLGKPFKLEIQTPICILSAKGMG